MRIMIKKKFIAFPVAIALLVGAVTGCGSTAPTEPKEAVTTEAPAGAAQAENSATEEKTEDGATEATSAEETENESAAEGTFAESEEEIVVKGITARSDEMRDISAVDLVAEMEAGFNMGNALDAHSEHDTTVASETSWGNPAITKEMVDTVCEKGFDSIRFPITWYNHVGPAPDYTVDPAWMDRVEEVVNYALDDGMYVLIDMHHEESWRIPTADKIDAADAESIAIWKQIAERFKDYGDHLIFEGLNEPRTKGSKEEWNGGTGEERKYVNQLNKSFVETVRATGGNNEKRLLVLTTYGGSNVPAALGQLEIPEGDEHLAVAIHAYEPYAFTFASGESWELFRWDGTHNTDIDQVMLRLKVNFLDKGIPVLLTEYGAVNKDENTAEVEKWVSAYVMRASLKGIPCFWWDNGTYNTEGEKFAILDRRNLSWYREEVVDAIIRESYKR